MDELLEALKPIIEAVKVNDDDTLGQYLRDDTVLWVASGSWSGSRIVTLGDVRNVTKIADAMLAARNAKTEIGG